MAATTLLLALLLVSCGGSGPAVPEVPPKPSEAVSFRPWGEVRPDPARPFAQFGASVAAGDGRLAIGAPRDDLGRSLRSAGSVAIPTPSGGLAVVEAPDASRGAQFGFALAWEGDGLVVGAPGEGAGREGAAYVVSPGPDGPAVVGRLDPGPLPEAARFGAALAAARGRVAVGAPGEGSVRVFERADGAWTLAATLLPPAGAVDFGSAVAFSDGGELLAVGAPGDEGPGRAFVYRAEGGAWLLEAELASDASERDAFGASLAFAGSALLVGVPEAPGGGEVRVLEPTGSAWDEVARLAPPPGSHGFGEALAGRDGLAAIGIPGFEGEGGATGSVAIAAPDASGVWRLVGEARVAGLAVSASYGGALAFAGADLAIGASGDAGASPSPEGPPGAAYLFRASAPEDR